MLTPTVSDMAGALSVWRGVRQIDRCRGRDVTDRGRAGASVTRVSPGRSAPQTGCSTITNEGVAEAIAGAEVLIDVSNSPSFADEDVMSCFVTSSSNLIAAARAAGGAALCRPVDRRRRAPAGQRLPADGLRRRGDGGRPGRGGRARERHRGDRRSGEGPYGGVHRGRVGPDGRRAHGGRRPGRDVLRDPADGREPRSRSRRGPGRHGGERRSGVR
jgi:hypothetical protein